MRNTISTIVLLTITATACFAESKQTKPEPNKPTAQELLAKFAQTQDKLSSSFISKSENTVKFEAFEKERPFFEKGVIYQQYRKIELRSDGNRFFTFEKRWGDRPGAEPVSEAFAQEACRLWDGNAHYQYTYSPNHPIPKRKYGNLFLTPKEQISGRIDGPINFEMGNEMKGFFYGGEQRIDKELQNAKKLTVLPERDNLNGSLCYVITAKANDSEYRLWIDPDHDFNIAKAIIKRGYLAAGLPQHYKNPVKGESLTELKNVRFKKVNDIWVPFECDYSLKTKTVQGDYSNSNHHHKVTKIILNPDHDSLGSFKTGFIKNGAIVSFEGVSKISCTWQYGKVIDKDGKVVMDCTPKKQDKSKASKPGK